MESMFPGTYRKARYLSLGEQKRCKCCGETLPIGWFAKDARVKSGYRASCRPCGSKGRKRSRRAASGS